MTEKQLHEKRMKRIRKKIQRYKYQKKEQELLNSIKTRRKLSTSKLVLTVFLLIGLQIIIYSQIMIWIMRDTSQIYNLIAIPSALASMALSIAGYYRKAQAENTVNGITYETAMYEMNNNEVNSNEETS